MEVAAKSRCEREGRRTRYEGMLPDMICIQSWETHISGSREECRATGPECEVSLNDTPEH